MDGTLWVWFFVIFYGLAILSSIHALFRVRTAPGCVAWILSLLFMPFLSVPAYWVFGRTRFHGYRSLMQKARKRYDSEIQEHQQSWSAVNAPEETLGVYERELEKITDLSFFRGNRLKLLEDGPSFFKALFEEIERARTYILVEFYVFLSDELGRELQKKLIQKAQEGVKVCILYDEIGSWEMADAFRKHYEKNGVRIHAFNSTRGPKNRFQLNFRNHRKIVVIDGELGFCGGFNVGTHYRDGHPDLAFWRDTQLRVEGPSALQLQRIFLEDWYWSQVEKMEVSWVPKKIDEEGCNCMALGTGPIDSFEKCCVFINHSLSSARKRFWISSPYFVPDEATLVAIKTAALRGVDVRLMIPEKADHLFVSLAAISYIKEICNAGVRVYKYHKGFMHSKVFVLDDTISCVGSVNLDNRSLRLNFESSLIVSDREFNRQLSQSFERDLEQSREISIKDYRNVGLGKRVLARFARLFAPIL